MAFIEIKLDNILRSRGISNREFARLVKTRPSTINDMCNNKVKHLPLEKVAAICEELNIELDDLLKLHKDQQKKEEV
jgi:putative transcriptional regulator